MFSQSFEERQHSEKFYTTHTHTQPKTNHDNWKEEEQRIGAKWKTVATSS